MAHLDKLCNSCIHRYEKINHPACAKCLCAPPGEFPNFIVDTDSVKPLHKDAVDSMLHAYATIDEMHKIKKEEHMPTRHAGLTTGRLFIDEISLCNFAPTLPGIKKVIFSNPCTIVLWEDGTKTIVRAQGKERFDREKGLAMAIAKKALGNKGSYYDVFDEHLSKPTAKKKGKGKK